jgi:hypothetical protein
VKNKMDNNEQQVRIALANEFAKRARDVYSDSGMVAAIKRDMTETIYGALDELVKAEETSATEAYRVGQLLASSFTGEYTPEKITQQTADLWMRGRNGYEAQFGAIFQLAEAEGEELPEGVKEFYDGLLKVTERRDNVVNTLVEKAKKDGISKAVNVQTVRAAIRKEFPTAEDYIQGAKDLMGAASQMVYSLSKMMEEENGVVGKLMPTLMEKGTQLYIDTVIKADVQVLYKE